MNSHRIPTMVETFDNEHIGQRAVRELNAVGFTETQIGVLSLDKTPLDDDLTVSPVRRLDIGRLWGLPILAGRAPGIGPAFAGGILGVLFWNTATIGAAGAMMGLGIPYEVAEFYEGRFRDGHTIVVVKAGTRTDIAHSVLNRFKQFNSVIISTT